MKNDIQTFLKSAGNFGCYALCLLDVAFSEENKDFDLVYCLEKMIENGYIESDFFVVYPEKILEYFTNRKWEVRKEGPDYIPVKGEYVINVYENGSTTHFDRPAFHPILKSNTIANGKLASKRICKKI